MTDQPSRRDTKEFHRGPHVGVDQAGASARWRRLGQYCLLVWFWGGMALTILAAVTQSGSFAWMADLQRRLLGTDDQVISLLPGALAWMLPFLVVNRLNRRFGHPFLAGLKDGVDGLTQSLEIIRLPDPHRALLRRALSFLGLGCGCVLGAFVIYRATAHATGRHQGRPLPTLNYMTATAPGGPLPPYARLIDVKPQTGLAWIHDYTFRNDRHHDIYTPLTPPSWHPGEPVALVMEDEIFVNDDGSWTPPPDALEGSLTRSGMPDWMVQEMRRKGINVATDPVLFYRMPLSGVTPGPDYTKAAVYAMVPAVAALVFFLLAAATYRQSRWFSR